MDIILLGDCIATGQNLLLPKIANNPNVKGQDFNVQKEYEKYISIWFLKNFKFKGQIDNILKEAYQEKIKQEKLLAWAALLNIEKNLSVAGETFQGMHLKIKNYLKKFDKPNLVLITDFSYTHRCVVVNKNMKKYVVKRDLELIDTPQYLYPLDVYKEFLKKMQEQELLGEKYQLKKNIKSFNLLTKFLKLNGIDYKFFVFHEKNRAVSKEFIDCTHLEKLYRLEDGTVDFQLKSKAQRHIADFVKKHI